LRHRGHAEQLLLAIISCRLDEAIGGNLTSAKRKPATGRSIDWRGNTDSAE